MTRKKAPVRQETSRIVTLRIPATLFARIRKSNSVTSKFIRSACLKALRYERLIAQIEQADRSGLKISVLKVVEK